MIWNSVLGLIVASVAFVNLTILALIEPMRRKMIARFLSYEDLVEKKHVGYVEFY